jgi:uncharacterized SAM-binding protein YcdF (DUF218 family)
MRADNINRISEFLALRNVRPEQLSTKNEFDLVVLLGSGLLDSIFLAERLMKQGVASKLLISGGIGHSTQDLRDRVHKLEIFDGVETEGLPEADIIREILVNRLGVDEGSVLVENNSTTCGGNAEESRATLDEVGMSLSRMLLLQDPTMQRRSQASFEKWWEDRPEVEIFSYAPFIPVVEEKGNGEFVLIQGAYPIWGFSRFASLIHGEIPRMHDTEGGYGPKGKGFISHVEIPELVLKAYDEEQTFLREFDRS